MNIHYTSSEMMTICASRMLKDGQVCFVGIGMPSAAANLARLSRTPNIVLIYESGAIGTKPSVLPLSIGDGELAETADVLVSVPEMFRYWLQGGHIDIGFLGAAQIDKYANINTTVIGDYHAPKVRLPGAGGAPEISTNCKEVLIILKQNSQSFVEHMDFITSPGYLDGGDSRAKLGLTNDGPKAVITDLGILEPDPVTKELVMTSLHPGVSVEQAQKSTGWTLKIAAALNVTPSPTAEELAVLRDLNQRTALAHAGVTS